MAFGKLCARGMIAALVIATTGTLASFAAWEAARGVLYATGSLFGG